MKISKMIEELQKIEDKHGDLLIEGGCMVDDRPLGKITVLDAGAEEWHQSRGVQAAGVFLE